MLSSELSAELDVKFQIHLCQKEQQQYANAIKTLESIPARQRTAKINMALGEMYQKERATSQAIICFREVISPTSQLAFSSPPAR